MVFMLCLIYLRRSYRCISLSRCFTFEMENFGPFGGRDTQHFLCSISCCVFLTMYDCLVGFMVKSCTLGLAELGFFSVGIFFMRHGIFLG